MHSKVLPVLSFPVALTSKETQFFSLSPSDGEFICPPGTPSLKQPLAEPNRVFNNPVKILQWILPSITELKEFPSPCACLHNGSMPTWQSVFSQNVQQLCTLLCTYAPAQCPLGRALRILSDSGPSLRTHSRVPPNAPLCICSTPTWQSSTESSVILSATVSLIHNLTS
jgi:hypothetical protein